MIFFVQKVSLKLLTVRETMTEPRYPEINKTLAPSRDTGMQRRHTIKAIQS